MIEYTTKHYASGNADDTKVLRRRMIQAGLYHPNAVAYFFLGRTALAVGLAMLLFLFAPVQSGGSIFWLLVGLGGIAGYLGPSLYLDKRIKTRKASISPGFRISWTCWWCAPMPASAWRHRSTASAAN